MNLHPAPLSDLAHASPFYQRQNGTPQAAKPAHSCQLLAIAPNLGVNPSAVLTNRLTVPHLRKW